MKLLLVLLCHLMIIELESTSVIQDRGANELRLELVQVVFRHGERTPLKYEHENYNLTDVSFYQPFGLEQLTSKGKRQAYNIGSLLKEKYKDLLGPKCSQNDVYAYASENARTKMSLQLALSGLFEPTNETIRWNADLKWLPVPYRYVPKKWDIVLNPNKNDKFMAIKRKAKASKEQETAMAPHLDFSRFLRDNSPFVGKIEDESSSELFSLAIYAYNVLHSNEGLNLPVPDWYTAEVKESHRKYIQFSLDVESFTPEMRKLNGGVLIKRFLRNIELNERGGAKDKKKMYLYSGHDLNIAAVQRTMGIKDPVLPDFASALVFEQYRNVRNDKVYVKSFVWDTMRNVSKSLKLDACDQLCYIDDFARILKNMIPSDAECRELLGDDLDSKLVDKLYGDLFSNG